MMKVSVATKSTIKGVSYSQLPPIRRRTQASCVRRQVVHCAQGESASEDRPARIARVAVLGAVAAGVISGVPTDLAQASEAYDLCKTDFCRERVLRAEDRKATISSSDLEETEATEFESAQEIAQRRSLERKQAIEKAAADRAAAAQDAAQRAAEQRAKIAADKAAKDSQPVAAVAPTATATTPAAAQTTKKSSNSLVGNVFGAFVAGAIVVAGAFVAATGSLKQLQNGEFEAVFEKAKAGWEAYPNKTVAGATAGSLIALDTFATSFPVFNLLLPGLLQICGIAVAGVLSYRYIKGGKEIGADITAVDSALPGDLPTLQVVKEKVMGAGKGSVKMVQTLKETDVDNLKGDIASKATSWWEGQENPVVVTAYGVGSVAALFVANYVIHLPVLGLVMPKVAEFTGVCTLVAALDRYNFRCTGNPEDDFNTAKKVVAETASELNLPGLK
ncbi:hypothetical protein CYMTET_38734 [Cymbomonas tetramitiformis]|uniref:Uncharacterized protein n=1 Tax=Cymbomonas tetramitiformis TaxID=36881 RepID=A0AAE0F570_9CHLO|nr:hypothetical protein CYMTET_38734 [Cymbomonas tetramitiformis]